jgi:NAD-dependent DNA ligase
MLVRSCEGLLGICQGLLADNTLNEEEVRYLDHWLLEHRAVSEMWPGSVIARQVKDVTQRGWISAEDLTHLKNILTQLLGGTTKESGAVDGLPTTLPLDAEAEVFFKNKTFCFTGLFLFGSRSKCRDAVDRLGGEILDNITMQLNYLVIGTIHTPDWVTSRYGRKIEKAVEYRSKGCDLKIISEERWSEALHASS